MTTDSGDSGPDATAVRVALWRALHLEVDSAPHVLDDGIGLTLADPGPDWRARGDMDPEATRGIRAWIVARARFIDDLVIERTAAGVGQYVILGAGLDTFAQRRPEIAAALRIYEVDQPGTQEWKRRRLTQAGYPPPAGLRLVPVDFEAGQSWWNALTANGFDATSAALVTSIGVSMYLTRDATEATLQQTAALAPGSTLAMTFMLPSELLDDRDRSRLQASRDGARASGTPFISFYTPPEMLALAREAGFKDARHVPGSSLADRYFAGRPDGLRPASGEDLLVAIT